MADRQTVKIVCTVQGYAEFWIEYDVTSWGLGLYNRVFGGLVTSEVITSFIPEHSIDWCMRTDEGTSIAHPGPNADGDVWKTIWDQFDIKTGREIHDWLSVSIALAMTEAMALPSKSSDNELRDGDGLEGAAERGAGGDAN